MLLFLGFNTSACYATIIGKKKKNEEFFGIGEVVDNSRFRSLQKSL